MRGERGPQPPQEQRPIQRVEFGAEELGLTQEDVDFIVGTQLAITGAIGRLNQTHLEKQILVHEGISDPETIPNGWTKDGEFWQFIYEDPPFFLDISGGKLTIQLKEMKIGTATSEIPEKSIILILYPSREAIDKYVEEIQRN